MARARAICHVALVAFVAPVTVAAQQLRGELRYDATFASRAVSEIGIGGIVSAGTYARIAGIAAVGGTRSADGNHAWATRAEVVARFLMDPYALNRFGAYGFGGLSVARRVDRTEPRVVLGVGLEGRIRRGRAYAIEVGLGGGVRVGGVLRWAKGGRR